MWWVLRTEVNFNTSCLLSKHILQSSKSKNSTKLYQWTFNSKIDLNVQPFLELCIFIVFKRARCRISNLRMQSSLLYFGQVFLRKIVLMTNWSIEQKINNLNNTFKKTISQFFQRGCSFSIFILSSEDQYSCKTMIFMTKFMLRIFVWCTFIQISYE